MTLNVKQNVFILLKYVHILIFYAIIFVQSQFIANYLKSYIGEYYEK